MIALTRLIKMVRRRMLTRDRMVKKEVMGMRPSRKKMGRKMMNINTWFMV